MILRYVKYLIIPLLFSPFFAYATFYPITSHFGGGPVNTGTDANGATYYIGAGGGGDYEEIGAITLSTTDYFWVISNDSVYSAGTMYISNNGGTPQIFAVPNNTNSFTVDGQTIYAHQFIGSQCTNTCGPPVVFSDLGVALDASRIYGIVSTTTSANNIVDQASMYSAIGFSGVPPADTPDSWNGIAPTTTNMLSAFTDELGTTFLSQIDSGNNYTYWDMSARSINSTTTQIQMLSNFENTVGERYLNLVYEKDNNSASATCPSWVNDKNGTTKGTNIDGTSSGPHAFYLLNSGGINHYFYICVFDMGSAGQQFEGMNFVASGVGNGTGVPYNTLALYRPLIGIFSSSHVITGASYANAGALLTYIMGKRGDVAVYSSLFDQDYNVNSIDATTTAMLVEGCFDDTYQGLLASTTYRNFGVGLLCGVQRYTVQIINWVFIPDTQAMTNATDILVDTFQSRAPWGYFTRVSQIWNSTSTVALPTATVHILTGPSSTEALSFDMGDVVSGGTTLLGSVRSPINNKSARDVFEPFVQLLLGIAVVFTILADLLGSHKHEQHKAT